MVAWFLVTHVLSKYCTRLLTQCILGFRSIDTSPALVYHIRHEMFAQAFQFTAITQLLSFENIPVCYFYIWQKKFKRICFSGRL